LQDGIAIIHRISTILAQEKISIFYLSTYQTDFVLVEEINLIKSIRALKNHYEIRTEGLSNSEQEELKKQYSLTHSKGVEHVVKNLALLSKHILLHRFLKEDLLSQIGITLINLLFYTESQFFFFHLLKLMMK